MRAIEGLKPRIRILHVLKYIHKILSPLLRRRTPGMARIPGGTRGTPVHDLCPRYTQTYIQNTFSTFSTHLLCSQECHHP